MNGLRCIALLYITYVTLQPLPTVIAVRCLCTPGRCLTGSGPDEECPDHVPPSYIKKDLSTRQSNLYHQIISALLKIRGEYGSRALLNKFKADIEKMSPETLIPMIEFGYEIQLDHVNLHVMKFGKASDIDRKLDQILALTPEPTDNQYCAYSRYPDDENVERYCGAVFSVDHRRLMKSRICHDFTVELFSERVGMYCTCRGDMCNDGDATRELSESATATATLTATLTATVTTTATATATATLTATASRIASFLNGLLILKLFLQD